MIPQTIPVIALIALIALIELVALVTHGQRDTCSDILARELVIAIKKYNPIWTCYQLCIIEKKRKERSGQGNDSVP